MTWPEKLIKAVDSFSAEGIYIMERWAIYIDIEGFSDTYETSAQGLLSLQALTEGIYRIGNNWCPETPERIFAHQLGDGFIVVGEFRRESMETPLVIAIALVQQVLFSNGTTKAIITEGDFADIQSCILPECMRDVSTDNRDFRLGRGLMTIFPVMGMALIRAVKLAKNAPSGEYSNDRAISWGSCSSGNKLG